MNNEHPMINNEVDERAQYREYKRKFMFFMFLVARIYMWLDYHYIENQDLEAIHSLLTGLILQFRKKQIFYLIISFLNLYLEFLRLNWLQITLPKSHPHLLLFRLKVVLVSIGSVLGAYAGPYERILKYDEDVGGAVGGLIGFLLHKFLLMKYFK
ncbi:hypothetical protein B9Z55_011828 [Caenorhabditis nigoni]|uniref:Uncharacterized protein n=1 Tax=Caenorhabditis nigoni TaxID=1611254 RepID=A0A2G5UM28_9PELO|nr:hypothetical protein B9Z55_011828 [Caenorhabditis nigoni]